MSVFSTRSVRTVALGGVAAIGLAVACAGGASAQNYYSSPSYDQPPAYDARSYDQDSAYTQPNSDYDSRAYSLNQETRFGDVIVRAPRRAGRDSATGAPIETAVAQREVRYDDLDLNSRWGAHELRVRIDRAARDACDEIDQRYTVIDTDDTSCVRRAVQDALYQTPIADADD